MPLLKKFVPVTLFAVILSWVIWQVEPPKSLTNATITHIIIFFLPLFFLLIFLTNLILRFYLKSLVLSFGIVLIFILQALAALNPVSFFLVSLAVILLIKSFKKPASKNYQAKIPQLARLKKQG